MSLIELVADEHDGHIGGSVLLSILQPLLQLSECFTSRLSTRQTKAYLVIS